MTKSTCFCFYWSWFVEYEPTGTCVGSYPTLSPKLCEDPRSDVPAAGSTNLPGARKKCTNTEVTKEERSRQEKNWESRNLSFHFHLIIYKAWLQNSTNTPCLKNKEKGSSSHLCETKTKKYLSVPCDPLTYLAVCLKDKNKIRKGLSLSLSPYGETEDSS